MIVGHGDIASVLQELDRPDVIFFASGVSNSQETRQAEYDREVQLLLKQPTDKHLIYFSSLCIFYSDTVYARHKREIEKLIELNFPHYTIVRIGNILWGNNPFTLINSLKNKLLRGEEIELKDEYRYIIDKEEFLHWLRMIPVWNCQLNITGRRLKVKEVFDLYANRSVER